LHFPFHLCIPSRVALTDLLAQAGFTEMKACRRGMHSRFHWRESRRVASAQEIRVSTVSTSWWSAAFADVVATFSSRYGEELVLEAT
jgi:hypothetical protein